MPVRVPKILLPYVWLTFGLNSSCRLCCVTLRNVGRPMVWVSQIIRHVKLGYVKLLYRLFERVI